MSNTVPCTGNCGVSNHVAGSASHKTCQARTSAMAAHPAGKGRGTSESVASDFPSSAAEEGHRQAMKYMAQLEGDIRVADHYRDPDDIREDINEIDAGIERLVTPSEYEKYDSTHATARRGGQVSTLSNRRDDLVTALVERSILMDRLGPEGFAEARDADIAKRKLFAVYSAVDRPTFSETDRALVEALSDEAESLDDQVQDYQNTHGDPWQKLRREWNEQTMGVTGDDYINAERDRAHQILSKTGDEDLLRG